jgi:hypothetical protein
MTTNAQVAAGWETERGTTPKSVVRELSRIPGVGPSLASDLWLLGVSTIAELRGLDPEALYTNLCERVGQHVDRCVLYVFRCAVYFASENEHDPELLKWWNWKDR